MPETKRDRIDREVEEQAEVDHNGLSAEEAVERRESIRASADEDLDVSEREGPPPS